MDLVKQFVKFLESLNEKGRPVLNIIRENNEEISFHGEIPKKELEEFLRGIACEPEEESDESLFEGKIYKGNYRDSLRINQRIKVKEVKRNE